MANTNRILSLGKLPAAPFARLDALFERLDATFVPCLPAWARRALARRRREFLIVPDPLATGASGATARLFLTAEGLPEALGTLTLDERQPLPASLTGQTAQADYPRVLMLPGDAVLRRQVSFPAQVRANLARVMRDEIDRLSPFQAEDVLHDFTILGGAPRAPRILVELALCRRDRVEGWIRRLAEAGTPVHRIAWDGAWPRANLLPFMERPRTHRIRFTPNLVFAALIPPLLIAVLATPVWQKTHVLERLERESRDARAQAVAVDDLRQELERARLGSTTVIQQKLQQPRILDLLGELTARIPDDTWIQTLDYNNGEADLRGESAQATALLALLNEARGIDQVSFRSPVTQVPRTGKERFNIAFRFRRVE